MAKPKFPKPELPSPEGFSNGAKANLDAADAVLGKLREEAYCGLMLTPCAFLYFRSIELALKSLIASYGADEGEIRNLGHNLSQLVARAEEMTKDRTPIEITAEARETIDSFSEYYRHKHFEYSEDWWLTPDIDHLKEIAHAIYASSKAHVKTTWKERTRQFKL